MPDPRYRVAIIGRSTQGDYGHSIDTVWLTHPQADLVAVADEHEAGRAKAVARLKAPKAYADYREMLRHEKPHIVSVCPRWPDCHRDMVVACAEAGASIFLEKPVARTLAEADAMLAACEKHHVKCAVAHQTRYSPRLAQVQQLLAAGKLGDLVELRGHGKEDQRGGGQDLMVLGTHIFDLMRLLAGAARWCSAHIEQAGQRAKPGDVRAGAENIGPIVGDRIHATFGFDKGIIGTFGTQVAKAGAGARFGLQVFGTKGVLSIQTGALPVVRWLDDPSWGLGKANVAWQDVTSAGVGVPDPQENAGNPLGNRWIVDDLIAAIQADRAPRGSLHDGRAALEMILAAYAAYRAGQTVPLPLTNRQHPLQGW
jgi:predicted dehydrogenase